MVIPAQNLLFRSFSTVVFKPIGWLFSLSSRIHAYITCTLPFDQEVTLSPRELDSLKINQHGISRLAKYQDSVFRVNCTINEKGTHYHVQRIPQSRKNEIKDSYQHLSCARDLRVYQLPDYKEEDQDHRENLCKELEKWETYAREKVEAANATESKINPQCLIHDFSWGPHYDIPYSIKSHLFLKDYDVLICKDLILEEMQAIAILKKEEDPTKKTITLLCSHPRNLRIPDNQDQPTRVEGAAKAIIQFLQSQNKQLSTIGFYRSQSFWEKYGFLATGKFFREFPKLEWKVNRFFFLKQCFFNWQDRETTFRHLCKLVVLFVRNMTFHFLYQFHYLYRRFFHAIEYLHLTSKNFFKGFSKNLIMKILCTFFLAIPFTLSSLLISIAPIPFNQQNMPLHRPLVVSEETIHRQALFKEVQTWSSFFHNLSQDQLDPLIMKTSQCIIKEIVIRLNPETSFERNNRIYVCRDAATSTIQAIALASCNYHKPKKLDLNFLATHPHNICISSNENNKQRVYGAGTAIICHLASLFQYNRIDLSSYPSAVGFYQKLGFRLTNPKLCLTEDVCPNMQLTRYPFSSQLFRMQKMLSELTF